MLDAFGLVIETEDSPGAEQPDCEVFPDNVLAFELFMACARHWTMVAGFGGTCWRAVPPSEVRQIMRWQGVKASRQGMLWQQYQLMEIEALKLLNQREAKAARKSG